MAYKKEMGFDNVREIKALQTDPEEVVIGWIHYTISHKNDCPFCYITYIRVKDEYQRKGIGTELMHRAMEDMKQHGCQKVKLDSFSNAVGFYKKRGFNHQLSFLRRCLTKPSVLPMKYTFDSK